MHSAVRTLVVSLLLASCASSQGPMEQVVVVETVVASNDAHEIERLVTVPIERAIHVLHGFLKTESQTTPGSSRVEVFYAGVPTPEAIKQVESAAQAQWEKFSAFASKPVVSIRSSARP